MSAGVYLSWEGRGQAKYVCNGVDYFQAIRYPTINDCFEHTPKDYHGLDTHEKAHLLNMQAWPDMTNLNINVGPASLNHTPHKKNIHHKTPFKFSKPKDPEMTLHRLLITKGYAYFRSTAAKMQPKINDVSSVSYRELFLCFVHGRWDGVYGSKVPCYLTEFHVVLSGSRISLCSDSSTVVRY